MGSKGFVAEATDGTALEIATVLHIWMVTPLFGHLWTSLGREGTQYQFAWRVLLYELPRLSTALVVADAHDHIPAVRMKCLAQNPLFPHTVDLPLQSASAVNVSRVFNYE